jgi:hypothetical protein
MESRAAALLDACGEVHYGNHLAIVELASQLQQAVDTFLRRRGAGGGACEHARVSIQHPTYHARSHV